MGHLHSTCRGTQSRPWRSSPPLLPLQVICRCHCCCCSDVSAVGCAAGALTRLISCSRQLVCSAALILPLAATSCRHNLVHHAGTVSAFEWRQAATREAPEALACYAPLAEALGLNEEERFPEEACGGISDLTPCDDSAAAQAGEMGWLVAVSGRNASRVAAGGGGGEGSLEEWHRRYQL